MPTTTIDFAAGETQLSFEVTILDDEVFEVTESFTAVLSNPTGGLSLGADSTATVNIADDGGAIANTLSAIL